MSATGRAPRPDQQCLEKVLQANPGITRKQLAVLLGCSRTVVGDQLKLFGLSTACNREHTEEAKQRMGRVWHRKHPEFGDRQRGAANPIHKVKHLYEDPEYVAKITTGIRAHVDQRRGSTYEEVYGPEKAAEYKQKLRDASPARLAKFQRKETKPERLLREMLGKCGIAFQQEAPLGFYTVDFLLEGPHVVIQADGDYWHANPAAYPVPTAAQKDRRRLDASCDSFCHNQGYRVLRFWESDLESHPEDCLKIIQEALRG